MNVDEARRELRQRMRHAFGHSTGGSHSELNLDGFMRELECFIDAKIEAAVAMVVVEINAVRVEIGDVEDDLDAKIDDAQRLLESSVSGLESRLNDADIS